MIVSFLAVNLSATRAIIVGIVEDAAMHVRLIIFVEGNDICFGSK